MFINCLICVIFLFIFIVIIYNLKINDNFKYVKMAKNKKFVPDTEWYPGTPFYEEYKK